jgi:hypothetical protein
MVDPEGQLLREIADERMTRDDVAMTYAFAIRQQDEVDFAKVNRAIMDRWSLAALKYIKTKAWKGGNRAATEVPTPVFAAPVGTTTAARLARMASQPDRTCRARRTRCRPMAESPQPSRGNDAGHG